MINKQMMDEIETLITTHTVEAAWAQVGITIKKRKSVPDGWHRFGSMEDITGDEHYVNGLLHNDQGYAVMYDGYPELNEYWIDGLRTGFANDTMRVKK